MSGVHRDGPAGRSRLTWLGVAVTCVALALVWAEPAGAAPRRPDLVVENMVVDTSFPTLGQTVYVRTDVRNSGTASSDPVTLTVTLPPQLRPATPAGTFALDEWTCSFAEPSWTCTRPGLAAGAFATPILPATVAAGSPNDVLTVSARVAPSRREVSVDNNAYQVSMTIAGTGTIRGVIWGDLDRDGQREAGEPPVGSGPDGVQRLLIIPRNAGETGSNTTEVIVNPDGTYSATVTSGLYVVQVWVQPSHYYFSPANVGDDATDSDLVELYSDLEISTGTSDTVSVSDGSDSVVDGGLFDRTQA
jgi:uncharacterized repeat protein (TIGR01451 family)